MIRTTDSHDDDGHQCDRGQPEGLRWAGDEHGRDSRTKCLRGGRVKETTRSTGALWGQKKFATPKQVATYMGCGVDRVLGLIHAKELMAADFRGHASKRPRWFITEENVEDFKKSRSSVLMAEPTAMSARPARQAQPVKDWFPES